MTANVGIAIGRRGCALVVIEPSRTGGKVVLQELTGRQKGRSLKDSLEETIAKLPAKWHTAALSIALSPGDLACADLIAVSCKSERMLESIGGSLAESRCAGEPAETLAIDVQFSARSSTQAVVLAIRRKELDDIVAVVKRVLPAAKLRVVTALHIALAAFIDKHKSCKSVSLVSFDETINFEFDPSGELAGWRAFPIHVPNAAHTAPSVVESEALATAFASIDFQSTESINTAFYPAVAAALVPDLACANLMRAIPSDENKTATKLHSPFLRMGAAAALFLGSLAFVFDREAGQQADELQACREAEQKSWNKFLPGETYRPGMLSQRMKAAASEYDKAIDANRVPSALQFWSEIATALPNPDQIGFSLESLQLSSDEGRLAARVSRGAKDPLANAAALEDSLEKSEALAARGEFEMRDSDVLVRMKLNYQPEKVSGEKKAGR